MVILIYRSWDASSPSSVRARTKLRAKRNRLNRSRPDLILGRYERQTGHDTTNHPYWMGSVLMDACLLG
ncbi:hypothetical protein I315_03562 [Cryptococcus gattii Ru294]|nr:hypothetical protein I315_03562 [Cryptococcus gattii Ru294]